MQLTVDSALVKRAKTPHELWMLNVFAFHLLLTPAILASGIGARGIAIPPILSALVIGWIHYRAYRRPPQPWFVAAHWRLAAGRARILLYGYGATAVLMFGAWVMTLGIEREATRQIMLTVLTRVAVMPTVILVFVTAVLESSAIYQADRGEVPKRTAEAFPPPEEGDDR